MWHCALLYSSLNTYKAPIFSLIFLTFEVYVFAMWLTSDNLQAESSELGNVIGQVYFANSAILDSQASSDRIGN